MRETGKAAQKVVTDKFGSLVQAAVPDPGTPASDPAYDVSDPSVLHPQTDTMDGLGKADKRDVRRDLVTYAMQDVDGGGDVWNKHHAAEAEPTVLKLRNDYADLYRTQLTLIQRMWPGEEHPWDGTVYVGTNLERDKGLSTKEKADPDYKDANKRKGYWGSFQTLIHEYLHACAHANFMASAGSGMQDRILTEGGCDYFTEQVWTDLEPKLPGVAYHHVLDGETDAKVATQHGVTVASLKVANPDPGITWASLKAPLKLLIPNH